MKSLILKVLNYSVSWILLIFGVILAYPYISNIATLYFWVTGLIALIGLPFAFLSETFTTEFRGNMKLTKLGKQVSYTNYLLLTLVSASFELYWLSAIFMGYSLILYLTHLPETTTKE